MKSKSDLYAEITEMIKGEMRKCPLVPIHDIVHKTLDSHWSELREIAYREMRNDSY